MQKPFETWHTLLTIFMGVFIFVSCITFYVKASQAKQVLYSTVQHVEIYGYDPSEISEYAHNSNNNINVVEIPVSDDEIDGYRYRVDVSFNHIFAIFNFSKTITYSATTRLVEYWGNYEKRKIWNNKWFKIKRFKC